MVVLVVVVLLVLLVPVMPVVALLPQPEECPSEAAEVVLAVEALVEADSLFLLALVQRWLPECPPLVLPSPL